MKEDVFIRPASIADIDTIGYLAYQVWPYAYRDTLSYDRLHYMLGLLYSPSMLEKQMREEGHRFYIAEIDKKAVGFAAYSLYAAPEVFKLQKLYVLMSTHGAGVGRLLLSTIENEARKAGGTSLLLNVKRDNVAIKFYEKCGFATIREEDVDIGNSYFMEDYVMQKNL